MSFLIIAGYISAVIIGLSLGFIGGGGSILTVPALVYLLGLDPVSATAYSLFIVGITALIGGMNYLRSGMADLKTAAIFAVPSLLAVFFTRSYIIPALPEEILSVNDFLITKGVFIMILFALLMVVTSFFMIKKPKVKEHKISAPGKKNLSYGLIILEGTIVGVLTGLVGAGGGFLIVPALVLLAKMPMKMAIGTSLFIIAAKSLIGFSGDIVAGMNVDWLFLTIFSLIAALGIYVGSYLNKFFSGQKLKPIFGWFVLVMGVFILIKEIFV